MRAFKIIRDPKAFELVADETRRKMIYLLRAKEASVNQLAHELELTTQAIYHHVKKLLDAGLIEVAREERVGHLVETFYRATAEVFEYSHGEGGSRFEENRTREALQALEKVGLPVQVDDEVVSKVVLLLQKMVSMGLQPELEEKIAGLEDLNFLTKHDMMDLAKFLTMNSQKFDEWVSAGRELRGFLRSKLAKPLQETIRQQKVTASS